MVNSRMRINCRLLLVMGVCRVLGQAA